MNWEVKLLKHKGEKRIAVYFEKNAKLIARIKTIEGARWSQSKRVWHIPDTKKNRLRFNINSLFHSQPSEEGMEHLKKFKKWLSSKRYSPNTIKTYGDALKLYFKTIQNTSIEVDKIHRSRRERKLHICKPQHTSQCFSLQKSQIFPMQPWKLVHLHLLIMILRQN